jgi:hypothetical protein
VDIDKLFEGYTAMVQRAVTASSYDSEVAQATMIILAQIVMRKHTDLGTGLIELAQGLQLQDMKVSAAAWHVLEGS